MNTKAYVILFSLFLAACGGGGSDSGVTVEVAEVAGVHPTLGKWQDASDGQFTYRITSERGPIGEGTVFIYKNGAVLRSGFVEVVNNTTVDLVLMSETHRCIMESDDSMLCSTTAPADPSETVDIGRLNRIN
jgi:hypothetical protein